MILADNWERKNLILKEEVSGRKKKEKDKREKEVCGVKHRACCLGQDKDTKPVFLIHKQQSRCVCLTRHWEAYSKSALMLISMCSVPRKSSVPGTRHCLLDVITPRKKQCAQWWQHRPRRSRVWVRVLAAPFLAVDWDKWLPVPLPHFSHLPNGDHTGPCFTELH